MEPVSELILLNTAPFEGARVLLVNPPRDELRKKLAGLNAEVSIFTQDFADYGWFQKSTVNAAFGIVPAAESLADHKIDQIIVFLPREKALLEMLLHALASTMPENATVWLVGENRSGIKSAGKRLQKYFTVVNKADSARHCGLLSARNPLAAVRTGTPFRLEDYHEKWMLGEPGAELRFVSLPGAFAHGRLDRGTEFLLNHITQLPPKQQPAGAVLDFGCGVGVLGLTLLQRDPSIWLTLLDSSALALESARLSLHANDLKATVLPSDGLARVQQRFDWIVSNPPFHHGVATDYATVREFFAASSGVLSRQGKMLLVCNSHLPYEEWLKDHFAEVQNVASTRAFKLLLTAQPKTGGPAAGKPKTGKPKTDRPKTIRSGTARRGAGGKRTGKARAGNGS